jgi:2'-5' RNA ligase
MASSSFFTGIVPPEDIQKRIQDIQNQFGDNLLEPHITITPPAIVTQLDSWLNAIEQTCNTLTPIKILLPKTGNFGKRVLFIDIVAPGIEALQKAIEDAVSPFEKENKKEENRGYNPHLTLGRKWCGFTKEHFSQMKILAEEYLGENGINFTVDFIRAYHKPSPGGRYEKLQDFKLKG